MTFGDFDPDDAFNREGEPDVEQFAIRLHEIRSALLELAGHDPLPPWFVYTRRMNETNASALVVPTLTIDVDPATLAQKIHEARQAAADTSLPDWDDLPPDARSLAIDIARSILAWLIRQGALR